MTDPTMRTDFEARFERRIRAHAAIPVRPVDAAAVAHSVIAGRRWGRTLLRPWGGSWSPWRGAVRTIAVIGLVGLLLAAMLAAYVGSAPRLPAPFAVAPNAPIEAAAPIVDDLRMTWMADQPADLSFEGESGPRRMAFLFTQDGTSSSVRVGTISRLVSAVTATGPTELRFTTSTPGNAVVRNGTTLGGCAADAEGLYRWSISPDGFTLALVAIDDSCAARAAILARTWAQSLGGNSRGGRGFVDAFTPSFAVTLPAGTYSTTRTSDAIEIWAADQSVGLLAWKDPQGFADPCDVSGGRYDIPPGAAAFVAYFRQNPGFTVLSTETLTMGGYPATHLVVEARSDHPCPTGWLVEWQPKAETTELSWHLSPGDRDSLYLIDRPDATVMVQVLEAPASVETQIVSSLQFLDHMPPEP